MKSALRLSEVAVQLRGCYGYTMGFTASFQQLPQSIQDLVRRLIEKSKPSKIILFGSRARGTHRENSDFDIAIVGRTCSETEWAKCLAEISELPITLFNIDLVEFEKVGDGYRAHINSEGQLLYG